MNQDMLREIEHSKARFAEGARELAIGQMKAIVDRFPDSAQPLICLGVHLNRMSDFSASDQVFARLRQRFPRNAWGWLGQGMVAEGQHRWADAAAAYLSTNQAFPKVAHGRVRLAVVRVRQGRPGQAMELLQAVLVDHPQDKEAQRLLDKLRHPRKVDVLNLLARHHGLSTYLEYNKPRCELALNEVDCAERIMYCISEVGVAQQMAEPALQRSMSLQCEYGADLYKDLDQLAALEQRYELIFFDPVHFRPLVDESLKCLCRLLRPGGYLVVHDCHPKDEQLVGEFRSGPWAGKTYQAFANFHRYNRAQSLVVDIDFGVGVIVNKDLNLDYPVEQGPDFDTFMTGLAEFARLMSFPALEEALQQGRF